MLNIQHVNMVKVPKNTLLTEKNGRNGFPNGFTFKPTDSIQGLIELNEHAFFYSRVPHF